MVVYQRNFSHDDHHSQVHINIVFPDGSQTGVLPNFIQGGLPDVAAADSLALIAFRNGSPASANNDTIGMRVTPDGTLLDNTLFGFTISAALGKQRAPAVVWNGAEFVVTWHDMRNQVAFFDTRTDVYAARVLTDATVVDPLGFPVVQGARPEVQPALAVGASGETLVATAIFEDGQPYSAYRIGTIRIGDPCSTLVTYCTAGTSASGCQAAISATGTPSATSPAGFSLLAAGVEGNKGGLFFFGSNGRQANAWGNGTSYQCVTPPSTRAGLLTAIGTNGLCDGSFAQDLNALWTAKPAKNPGAGAVTQAQLWYRDPLNTSNRTTSLSNAVEFTVCP
jgi:hypothetical protein